MAYFELPWRPFLGHEAWSWTTPRRGNVFITFTNVFFIFVTFFTSFNVFLFLFKLFLHLWWRWRCRRRVRVSRCVEACRASARRSRTCPPASDWPCQSSAATTPTCRGTSCSTTPVWHSAGVSRTIHTYRHARHDKTVLSVSRPLRRRELWWWFITPVGSTNLKKTCTQEMNTKSKYSHTHATTYGTINILQNYSTQQT